VKKKKKEKKNRYALFSAKKKRYVLFGAAFALSAFVKNAVVFLKLF